MEISEAQQIAYKIANDKGFHKPMPQQRAEALARLALIGSEVGEATQLVKRHCNDGFSSYEYVEKFSEELADIVIRVFDLAGLFSENLEPYIVNKMNENKTRPYMYGTPDVEISTKELENDNTN